MSCELQAKIGTGSARGFCELKSVSCELRAKIVMNDNGSEIFGNVRMTFGLHSDWKLLLVSENGQKSCEKLHTLRMFIDRE